MVRLACARVDGFGEIVKVVMVVMVAMPWRKM